VENLRKNNGITINCTIELTILRVVFEPAAMDHLVNTMEESAIRISGLFFGVCDIKPCIFSKLNAYMNKPQCTLETIEFDIFSLTRMSMSMLTETLRNVGKIQKIKFGLPLDSNGGIDDCAVSEIILTSNSVTELHLVANLTVPNFGVKICKSIEFDTKLTKLTFCNLHVDTMVILLNSLVSNRTLKEVTTDVQWNSYRTIMEDRQPLLAVSFFIGKIIEANKTLEFLTMKNTIFTERDVALFLPFFLKGGSCTNLVFATAGKTYKAHGSLPSVDIDMNTTATDKNYRFRWNCNKSHSRKNPQRDKNVLKKYSKTIKTKKKTNMSRLAKLNIHFFLPAKDDDCNSYLDENEVKDAIDNDVDVIIDDATNDLGGFNLKALDCLDIFTNVCSITIK